MAGPPGADPGPRVSKTLELPLFYGPTKSSNRINVTCSPNEWFYQLPRFLTVNPRISATAVFSDTGRVGGSMEHCIGFEPMTSAWKAEMLPLHQQCTREGFQHAHPQKR